ncbi:MAG: alpha/beta hydrolase [Victivallales bacterium]|nr:alpha/beta hydrolase [Victivallales bacterium]
MKIETFLKYQFYFIKKLLFLNTVFIFSLLLFDCIPLYASNFHTTENKDFAEKINRVQTFMGFGRDYTPKFFESPVDFINVLYNTDFHFKTKLYTSDNSPYTTTPIKIAYDIRLGKNKIGEEVIPDYALIIIPGSAGSYFKYTEFMYDLQKATGQKLALFMLDMRGQGFSTWFNPKAVERFNGLYVDSFDHYIKDLKYFYEFIVKVYLKKLEKKYNKKIPLFLYGHSLGGGIAAKYIEEYPDDVSGAILSSPAIQALGWTARNLAFWSIYAIVLHGGGPEYVPTGHNIHKTLPFSSIFSNTSCKKRWNYWQKVSSSEFFKNKKLKHPLSGGEVLRMGYPTYWWTFQLIRGTNPIEEKEFASKITAPFIVLKAGFEDLVCLDAMETLIKNTTPGLGKIIEFPYSQHDIMLEKDSIRQKLIKVIIEFLKKNSTTS